METNLRFSNTIQSPFLNIQAELSTVHRRSKPRPNYFQKREQSPRKTEGGNPKRTPVDSLRHNRHILFSRNHKNLWRSMLHKQIRVIGKQKTTVFSGSYCLTIDFFIWTFSWGHPGPYLDPFPVLWGSCLFEFFCVLALLFAPLVFFLTLCLVRS